jgi:hypothetical protein
LREHTASESTDGLIALPSRCRAVALQSGDTLEVVEGSLSRYRHSKAGHYGEGEEEEVVHAARTAGGHDEPISEPETPKQRPAALDPTKTPAQRSNVSHKSTLHSVDHSDGLALPTDTSMQSEVSEINRTYHFEMLHLGVLPRQRRTLHPKYLRALICSIVPLSLNCTINNQNIYVSSRTSLVHQGQTAATDTHLQTTIAHAMKKTEIIRRASSTLTMKADAR